MKISYLKIILLSICALFINKLALAATFDWTGAGTCSGFLCSGGYINGTLWSNPDNWTVGGLTTTSYPGQGGSTTDIVRFGVTGSTYTNQPVLSANVTVASITFGRIQYVSGGVLTGTSLTGTILTVNSATLTVTGDITQDVNTNASGTIFNDMRGTGTISCTNIQIGTNSATYGSFSFLFSEVNTLTVSNNVNIHLNVKQQNGSGFRLEGGTMTINNQITFTNHSVTNQNGAYFTVNALTSYKTTNTVVNPTLILNATNAIGTIPVPYASCNFYGDHGGKATVNYKGANPVIYTTSVQGFGPGGGPVNPNAATDRIYDNLIIQGSGTAVIGGTTAGQTSYLNIDSTFTTNSNVSFSNATNTATKVGVAGSTAATWTNNSAATITGGTGSIDINGTLSNAGTMNMGTGALNIARNYTNTGTFTPNASALISFDGTTQTLTDATATGTNFYNVTFTTGGTKTMASGSKFTVAPTYTLNVNSSSTLAVGNATSTTTALTILSTAAGDASIGSLSAGTITGSINVQRYVKGTLRRYMLMSSPVLNTTSTFLTTGSLSTYNLLPLIATTYITGPGGTTNGFDDATATGNSPSVFVYDENAPVTSDVNQVLNNEYKPFSSTSQGLPPANGFLYYFRGSRSVANPFVRPFPATDNATLNFFGTVIKGTGASNATLTANIVNFPSTPPTYYTTTAVSAPATLSYHTSTPAVKQGLNLIGNPYASVIDLHTLYTVNTTNKFYYMLVKDASTGTNSSSTKFALYDASTGSIGTGASRYALSGQGFFTVATSASAIKFDETMKVAYSNYSGALPSTPVFNVVGSPSKNIAASFAASPATNNAESSIPRLTMNLVQDTVVHNSTDINFDENATARFVPGEDAPYYRPSGQGDLFYSLSSDSVGCFANYTGNLEKLKRVNLIVTFSNYGTYKLTSPIKKNIDARYSIYLKDKYTNDSLDVVHNAEYAFKVESNPASYAHDRFYLKIGIVPGHDYRLLTFTGKKVTEGVALNWETNNESNFTKFAVQKSADGGKTFLTIDSLQSTGTGKYTYTDQTPGSGQIIYRLSQNLVTGETKLSDNLNFEIRPGAGVVKFLVYPTVVSASTVNIKVEQTSTRAVRINIVSPSGAIVRKLSAIGTNTLQENVNSLGRGLYIVVAVNEGTGDRIGSGMFFKQ
ncbi:beta strand repeat-containing protein [Mucilaginibacter sp. R-33]|uniref:beta strand repeat-containing protein n=1 Tax=Mucilaginibacter sp. R-33 TaxID=3416711 RepID=UPI003CF85DEB